MAYSKSLCGRVREALSGEPGVTEKKMFGGVCFLLRGNMQLGIWQDALIVRLGVEGAQQALTEPFVRPFDVTGKPMRGWAVVDPDGVDTQRQLRTWIERTREFVSTLPPK